MLLPEDVPNHDEADKPREAVAREHEALLSLSRDPGWQSVFIPYLLRRIKDEADTALDLASTHERTALAKIRRAVLIEVFDEVPALLAAYRDRLASETVQPATPAEP